MLHCEGFLALPFLFEGRGNTRFLYSEKEKSKSTNPKSKQRARACPIDVLPFFFLTFDVVLLHVPTYTYVRVSLAGDVREGLAAAGRYQERISSTMEKGARIY